MITEDELIKEIARLPFPRQRAIIGRISRSMKEGGDGFEEDKFRRELSVEERIAIAMSLSGSFKPDSGYTPMTKEEDREVIMEYLEEKYR